MSHVTSTTATTFKFQETDTINTALEQASKLSNEAMQNATKRPYEEGRNLLLHTAERTLRLIENIQICFDYNRSLELPYKTLNKEWKEKFDLLESLCNALNSEKLEDLTSSLSINVAPIRDPFPTVEKMEPRVVHLLKKSEETQSAATRVALTITGKFPQGDNKKWDHSLTLQGKKYEPIARSKKELKYEVEVSLPAEEKNEFSILEGVLQVTWSTGYVYSWTTSQFSCPLVVRQLPSSPVSKIVVCLSTQVTEEKEKRSELIEYKDLPATGKKHHISPDEPGWKIKPGSVTHEFLEYGAKLPEVLCTYSTDELVDVILRPPENDLTVSGGLQFTHTETKTTHTEEQAEHKPLTWGEHAGIFPGDLNQTIKNIYITSSITGQTTALSPEISFTNEFIQLIQEDGIPTLKVKALNELTY